MKIELERVREEPLEWREALEIAPSVLGSSELLELSQVVCEGRVSYVDPGFLLAVHVSYQQTLVCNRCLQPTTQPVETDIELLLMVEGPRAVPGEVALTEEEMGMISLSEERFDTEPLIFEQLQLGIPMKPVCRQECKGLCALCGADLNQGECSCDDRSPDPRWAALEEIRHRLSPGGDGEGH